MKRTLSLLLCAPLLLNVGLLVACSGGALLGGAAGQTSCNESIEVESTPGSAFSGGKGAVVNGANARAGGGGGGGGFYGGGGGGGACSGPSATAGGGGGGSSNTGDLSDAITEGGVNHVSGGQDHPLRNGAATGGAVRQDGQHGLVIVEVIHE